MRPDLRVVQGGRAPRPVPSDNIIYLEDSRHGIEPPSVIEVCERLAPRLPSGVGGLHGMALSVFLEMTGERWLQSRGEIGLHVSLSGLPRVKKRSKRRPVAMSLAVPHWTLVLRDADPLHGHYHLLLPARVRSEPMLIPYLWDPGETGVPVLHRLTFVPGPDGWAVADHERQEVAVTRSEEVRSLLRGSGA